MGKLTFIAEGDLYVAAARWHLMSIRMTLPNAETRAAMLATGMEASYARLESMI